MYNDGLERFNEIDGIREEFLLHIPEKIGKKRDEYMKSWKKLIGCFFCGYRKCDEALHLHHIEKNNKITASVMKKVGTGRLKEELRKCMVLCANCHIELHKEMR